MVNMCDIVKMEFKEVINNSDLDREGNSFDHIRSIKTCKSSRCRFSSIFELASMTLKYFQTP